MCWFLSRRMRNMRRAQAEEQRRERDRRALIDRQDRDIYLDLED